ncbi:glycosyl hydrolase [Alloscardovia theropitheci]|uniref:Glycosyl hydrolase n=1 Tax=Alloscardovia theropitheci TaxID=2496842 RepID=A0A4R0QPM2_9BIFI|nr:glycoside hydrolase family 30 protein [Alloscardovia theropitheci]TCD54173.1 glycosyl hydrolase [Alloscardovia theropitheci]
MTTWISTTQDEKFIEQEVEATNRTNSEDLQLTGEKFQALRGFGGCFNELGYQALTEIASEEDAEQVFKELFDPSEMNFVFNRAPVGANDFSLNWYSYDETDGDLELEDFSIERDEKTLIPYIQRAQKYQPDLKLFSSPWSPPTWMKFPKVYNFGRLVMEPENLQAYANYFVKYVRAYAEHGIKVTHLFPQNEVFADQKFPSCLYSSEDMKVFVRDYLGPTFEREGLDTQICLGTLNGPEEMAFTGVGYGMRMDNYNRWVDDILFDDEARKYIKGIGYQWAGRDAVQRTHESWPELEIFQTESECGNGENAWDYAEYIFHLINHYLRNGATTYTYWNMVLTEVVSTWGWMQNSLFSVDSKTGEITRNPEYYVMKHFAKYVKPGARVLGTSGHFNSMAIAFENVDGTVVVVAQNALNKDMPFTFANPDKPQQGIDVVLKARSFNTFILD